jgi:hypothetical protein
VLVGIGTFFAAVFRAPMTSVFMVFEVSASYVIIVPVMVANIVSYLVSRKLSRLTFFDMVAAQDGLELPSHERQRDARRLSVEDAMRPAGGPGPAPPGVPAPRAAPVLHPDQSLDTALHLFGRHKVLEVVSRQDLSRVLGTLSLADVLRAYGVQDAPPASDQPDATAPRAGDRHD